MCAIAGFLSLESHFPENTSELLQKTIKSMSHRGPDGLGVCTNFKYCLGLAHARLAIIDPTPEGRQPFFSSDKSVVTVFNGEIYNYKELRAELESLGHRFYTKTDTEVVVEAFQEWGIGCLDRLFGMFAIAIFDTKTQEFFLVRDRIGVKPVFFSLKGGFLSFASEHKALFNLPWISKDPNPLSIYHYLTFMSCPAPLSFSSGIYKLPAGYFLKINAQKELSFSQWYCPIKQASLQAKENAKFSLDQATEKLDFLLNQSIKRRMIADVPVTIYLSGGLDSSLIAAYASQLSGKINTFNVSFKNQSSTDEKIWARQVSEIFGTAHHELEIEEDKINSLVEEMEEACDGPLADCVNVPFFSLSKFVRSQGFKVALVGEGADELFFGYPEYKKYAKIENFFSHKLISSTPVFVRKLIAKSSAIFGQKASITGLFQNWAQNKELFWGAATAFSENEKFELKKTLFKDQNHKTDPIVLKIFPTLDQGPDSANFVDFYLWQISKYFPRTDFHQKIAFLELKNRIPDLLLTRADNMGMASGIEARVPFLDHNLVEFVLSLPEKIRLCSPELKPLLKLVAKKRLPEGIVNRRKCGFSAPIDKFFENNLFFPATNNLERFSKIKKAMEKQAKTPLKKWVLKSLSTYF